jgi:hypothetical protein
MGLLCTAIATAGLGGIVALWPQFYFSENPDDPPA